jgi:hypothetical protein
LLSENIDSTVTYAYSDQDFEDPELADFDSHTAALMFSRNLEKYLPSTSVRLNIGCNRYNYPDSRVNNYSGTFGAYHEVTERLKLALDLGGRHTRQRGEDMDSGTAPTLREGESGFTGQLLFSFKGEYTKHDLTVSHDIKAASGRNAVTERTALIFNMNRQFTYSLRGLIKVGYYANKADQGRFATKDIDESTLRVQTGIHFEIRDDMILDTSYVYTRIKDEIDHESFRRNLIALKLIVVYPVLE